MSTITSSVGLLSVNTAVAGNAIKNDCQSDQDTVTAVKNE